LENEGCTGSENEGLNKGQSTKKLCQLNGRLAHLIDGWTLRFHRTCPFVKALNALQSASLFDKEHLRKKTRRDKSKRQSLLKPMYLVSVLHPFAAHLKHWEQGSPVDCGATWSLEAIQIAVAQGAHPTAQTKDAMELVHKDVENQVKVGFSDGQPQAC
jgi:hypothetical protein